MEPKGSWTFQDDSLLVRPKLQLRLSEMTRFLSSTLVPFLFLGSLIITE